MSSSPTLPRRQGALGGGTLTPSLTADNRASEVLIALHATDAVKKYFDPVEQSLHSRLDTLAEIARSNATLLDSARSESVVNYRMVLQSNADALRLGLSNVHNELLQCDRTHAAQMDDLWAELDKIEGRTLIGLVLRLYRWAAGWFR